MIYFNGFTQYYYYNIFVQYYVSHLDVINDCCEANLQWFIRMLYSLIVLCATLKVEGSLILPAIF